MLVYWKIRNKLYPYLFLLPALSLLAVFMFYPITVLLRLTQFRWDIIGDPSYVGIDNFVNIVSGDAFLNSIQTTFIYVGVSVPINFCVAFALALMLNQKLKLRNGFRAVMFFPAITSMAAIGMLWKYMFAADYGVINYVFLELGLEPVKWLVDPNIALYSVVLTTIWYGFGWNMVIFLAGLQNIPNEYYESARIDGAGPLSLFLHITIPLLKPIILFIIVMAIIYTFRTFDIIYVMTQGGPGRATQVLMMYLYTTAFVRFRFGEGAAISFILFIIVFCLTYITLKVFRSERAE